jgi:hypothetical protein
MGARTFVLCLAAATVMLLFLPLVLMRMTRDERADDEQ